MYRGLGSSAEKINIYDGERWGDVYRAQLASARQHGTFHACSIPREILERFSPQLEFINTREL